MITYMYLMPLLGHSDCPDFASSSETIFEACDGVNELREVTDDYVKADELTSSATLLPRRCLSKGVRQTAVSV